ncbi:hypothetical protein BRARA_C03599 [Brassica rapa]|uniref:F-box domain-containing protein n=1 Tax=Brassica campestris TaxID=3711 RepID=A0A398A4V5_BRACM|nr:hypothetical protein BRARA_C03599 [Brassica rapa]
MRRELPFDVVVEILARTPVKDLIRFRCVCKTWRSLFQEERFYRQHMTHAPTRIVSFRRSDTLLGRFSYQDDMTFGVWNPSLRELRRVQTRHVSNWAEIGFGYDHSSQDYKIVLVLDMRGSHSKALVLSLTSGESRMIDVPCLENIVVLIRMRLPGTLVGENIYWQVYDDKTFNYCPGTSNCGKAFPQVIEGLRGGGLCTVGVDALSGDIIVWSAQHDEKIGGIKCWSKICNLSRGLLEISTSCSIAQIHLVSAITYGGLLLVLVGIDGKESIGRESKLVAYNLEEKSLTNVEISLPLYTYGSTLLTYVETLVPIPGSFS